MRTGYEYLYSTLKPGLKIAQEKYILHTKKPLDTTKGASNFYFQVAVTIETLLPASHNSTEIPKKDRPAPITSLEKGLGRAATFITYTAALTKKK